MRAKHGSLSQLNGGALSFWLSVHVPFLAVKCSSYVGRNQEEKNMSWTLFPNNKFVRENLQWHMASPADLAVALLPAPPEQGNGYRIILTYLLARAVFALVAITGPDLFFSPGGGASFAYRDLSWE